MFPKRSRNCLGTIRLSNHTTDLWINKTDVQHRLVHISLCDPAVFHRSCEQLGHYTKRFRMAVWYSSSPFDAHTSFWLMGFQFGNVKDFCCYLDYLHMWKISSAKKRKQTFPRQVDSFAIIHCNASAKKRKHTFPRQVLSTRKLRDGKVRSPSTKEHHLSTHGIVYDLIFFSSLGFSILENRSYRNRQIDR